MKHTKRKLGRQTGKRHKNTICVVDQDMVRRHAAICNILELVMPRWSHCAGGALLAQTDHGFLVVARYKREPKLGWVVLRLVDAGAEVPLVHTDGRDVVFKRRSEAEVAALVHARDGFDNWSPIRDKLQWQETAAQVRAA